MHLCQILASLWLCSCNPKNDALTATQPSDVVKAPDASDATFGDIKALKPLAQKGDVSAQSHLGFMYSTGAGVPKDDAEAINWVRKAAEQGDVSAQSELGRMYADGVGVPKDDAGAYKWLLLATAKGDEYAKSAVTRIEKTLTPDQRAEGQRMAREFKPIEKSN